MTNIEDVIRDVALKNRQSVKEDDPVMALVTIMTRIALDWQAAMDGSLESHRSAHEELAHRWRTNAATKAEQILNAALTSGREAMGKGVNEGTGKVLELARKQIEDVLGNALAEQKAELEAIAEKFRRYCLWMLAGNGAVMLLALFIAARF